MAAPAVLPSCSCARNHRSRRLNSAGPAHPRSRVPTPHRQGATAMSLSSSPVQGPLEAWTTLIQDATTRLSAAPLMPTMEAPADGQDPWDALIDQLWQMNPVSRVLPLDPGEMSRAFQQLWRDALRNPSR